jgi:hypothetical protein
MELEITGVVISVAKNRKETKCLQVDHSYGDYLTRKFSARESVKNQIKKAEILARGSDLDPWANAERRTASEVFGT